MRKEHIRVKGMNEDKTSRKKGMMRGGKEGKGKNGMR